jgi:hypothetical protein
MTEEWYRIESASTWADLRLETIEHMLGSFGEVVTIVCASMTHDLIPYGQVSAPFRLFLFSCYFMTDVLLIV